MLNRFAKWISMILIGSSSVGCSYVEKCTPYIPYLQNLDFSSNVTTIKIRTTKSTNYGAPLYVLVKSTDFPNFLIDDYPKITSLIINPPTNQACFSIVCIVPGINQKITIPTPENQCVAIYCLFTHPGEIWKQIFELEDTSQTITIELGENEIISIDK